MLRAYVLAGGPGTRLRARLGNQPKVLVPFRDRSFLDVQLEWLAGCGVNEVVLALGLRAEPVLERIRTRAAEAVPKVSWTVDPLPLGTGGALARAARDETRTFLAVNGDTLAEVDLAALLGLHEASGAVATLACYKVADTAGRRRVEADREGRVQALGGPAAGGEGWVGGGLCLCEPEVVAAIPQGRPSSFEDEVLPGLVAAGRAVRALRCRGRCHDIGTPAGLARAEREWHFHGPGGEDAP
jgi:NDP-sugar pyrophosphorylase family protein